MADAMSALRRLRMRVTRSRNRIAKVMLRYDKDMKMRDTEKRRKETI